MCAVFEYRDISALLNNSVDAVYIYDGDLPEYDVDFLVEDGFYLTYYTGSRIHTDEEIAAENERMLKIQRTAIKYMREYHGFEPNGDCTWRLFGSFHRSGDSPYYSFSLDYVTADSTVYIDEQSLEVIPPETLLCENWQEYVPEEKRNELRFEVVYQSAKEDQFTVQYSYLNEISSTRSWGSFYIPKDKLNPRYFG